VKQDRGQIISNVGLEATMNHPIPFTANRSFRPVVDNSSLWPTMWHCFELPKNRTIEQTDKTG